MAQLNRDKYPLVKGKRRTTSPQTIARAELTRRALELRREHLTIPEIARRLSVDGSSLVTESTVTDLITSALRATIRPAADDLRLAHLDRLDKLYNRAAQIAAQDKNRDRVPALGMALKALEREAALLGLDAPKQTEVKDTTPHEVPPATAEDIVAQLAEEARADLAKQGLEYDTATGAVRPIQQ